MLDLGWKPIVCAKAAMLSFMRSFKLQRHSLFLWPGFPQIQHLPPNLDWDSVGLAPSLFFFLWKQSTPLCPYLPQWLQVPLNPLGLCCHAANADSSFKASIAAKAAWLSFCFKDEYFSNVSIGPEIAILCHQGQLKWHTPSVSFRWFQLQFRILLALLPQYGLQYPAGFYRSCPLRWYDSCSSQLFATL